MLEEGVVFSKLKGGWVVVRFDRKSACDNCRMCLMPKDKPYVELKLKNKINATVGDKVAVSMGDRAVVRASFIVYIIPLIILSLTLVVSTRFVSELMAISISLLSLIIAFTVVSWLDKLIKRDREYLPCLVSIINNSQQKEEKMTKVTELNDTTFNDMLNSTKPTIVDFWAPWCGPCRMLAPIFEEVANELSDVCNFCKVDVDAAESTAKEYSIMSVPTMIIFQNGQEKERINGLHTKAQIIAAIEKYKG